MRKKEREAKALGVRWSKKDNALKYHGEVITAQLLYYYLECWHPLSPEILTKELEARGYDLKTLRFTIEKKSKAP